MTQARQDRYITTDIEATVTDAYRRIQELKRRQKKRRATVLGGRFVKALTVKFRSERDAKRFAAAIHQVLDLKDKTIVYDPKNKGRGGLKGVPKPKQLTFGLGAFYAAHWVGMPEFVQEDSRWEWHRVKVLFETQTAYKTFAYVVRQFLKPTTPSIYFPEWSPANLTARVWKSTLPKDKKHPRYPVYVISKGRSFSRLTIKTLEKLGIAYHVVVEPQDFDDYAAVVSTKNILRLPSNTDPDHPTGPGRARNFCRDHAWAHGHARHWVMDDNIQDFFRLNHNRRVRVGDGAIFRAAEDFVDRYKNILVAGFQYRHFAASKSKYPPFVANTRIYSCLLIDNRKLFRWKDGQRNRVDEIPILVNAPKAIPMGDGMFLWRERYNEDTILSLDALENQYATIQFNAFLQGKMGTQKLAGGNSDVFYFREQVDGEEEQEEALYHEEGTLRKSLLLEIVYPQVAKLTYKFNRPHHEVDYSKYNNVPLIPMTGRAKPKGTNSYGMRLTSLS